MSSERRCGGCGDDLYGVISHCCKPVCHTTKPQSEWCDSRGPGGFMGHTCALGAVSTRLEDRVRVIAKNIAEIVVEKNAAYGSSFAQAGEFLKLLYPEGLHTDQYGDALLLVRIFDKQMRIANRKDAFSESPYRDLAGYGILGAAKDEAK